MPGISALLDSDMEDNTNYLDENSILSGASDADEQRAAPAKKTRKRHRVTMPKPKSKVVKTSPAPTTRKASKKSTDSKRKAIEAQIEENMVQEPAVDEDTLQDVEPKPKARGRSKALAKAPKNAMAQKVADDGATAEIEQTPIVARSSHAAIKSTKAAPKVVRVSKAAPKRKVQAEAIPETQQSESMDIDTDVDELEVAVPKPASRTRTSSTTRNEIGVRRRAGSASDTERGDPNLRRRLGDITRKFENIDTKYRNLRDVGISEANANVEKLRKQCEATTEASNNLVASLKKELASQVHLANESRKLKKEAQSQVAEIDRLQVANSDLVASLTSAQNEIKALQAKLAASRSQSTEPISSRVPGTALKNHSGPRAAPHNLSEAAHVAQMKLDLYGDLTGLIIRSAKRADDGDHYDCIQTGRNGTLHFKLFIDHEDAKNASFEETEFLYTPHLDRDRDQDMIELMPPYLTEDITFARQNAAKFYQRVVDTLTRRVETE